MPLSVVSLPAMAWLLPALLLPTPEGAQLRPAT